MPFSVVRPYFPMARAYESAVQSLGVLASRSTPYSTSSLTSSTPPSIPQNNVRSPPPFMKLGSAPERSSALAASRRPRWHADIRGVYPSGHPYARPNTKFTSAPSSIFL